MLHIFLQHEEKFRDWKDSGYPDIKEETRNFIENILRSDKKLKMWDHQTDGLLRTIYAYEILDKKDLLLNIVTGGGKTAIIAAVIFWLKTAHDVNKFVILAPNTIVRDRLQSDFKNGHVFKKFEFATKLNESIINDLTLHVMEPGKQPAGMTDAGIILGNIQQLYPSHSTGGQNLAFLLQFAGSMAIFNDEAHNTPAEEYSKILDALSTERVLRLDTTATPERADGQEPDTAMIQHYDITHALKDGIIKSVVVYVPEVKLIEMIYTNPDTGEKRNITELDAEFKEAEKNLKAFHWILDPEPMRKQMSIAVKRHEEHKHRARGRYKPILFVVTMSIEEGKIARKMLKERFNIETLLVTEESDDRDRDEALRIGTFDSKYEAVVSVLMLREGWDVPEVSTILLLRKFSSPVYGQQVIGRGLRKIIRNPAEPEILSVIDHPKLEHDWLWSLVAVSKVKPVVNDDDIYDPDEDLPPAAKIPILDKPENIIKIPPPSYETNIDFLAIEQSIPNDKTEKDWESALDCITYEKDTIRISKTQIKEIIAKQLENKNMEIMEGDKENDFRVTGQYPRPILENLFNNAIQESCSALLAEAGYGPGLMNKLYKAMKSHIQTKIFLDSPLSQASTDDIEYAIHMMPEIRKNFTQSIVAGIVEEAK